MLLTGTISQYGFGQQEITASEVFGSDVVVKLYNETLNESIDITHVNGRLEKKILKTFNKVPISLAEESDHGADLKKGMLMVLNEISSKGFDLNDNISRREYKNIIVDLQQKCGEAPCPKCCKKCTPCPK